MSPIAASIWLLVDADDRADAPEELERLRLQPGSASGSRAWHVTPRRTSTGVLGSMRTTGVPP